MHPKRLLCIAASTLICLAVQFSALKGTKAQQSKPLVEAVEVIGNRRLRDKDILRRIRTRAGEVYDLFRVERDLESIIALGVFDKTQTRVTTEAGVRGGIVVLFEVAELPLIKELRFQGLSNVQQVKVIELLRHKRIDIAKGAVYNPDEVRKAIRVIKEFLTSRNWSNVTVTSRVKTETAGEVSLTLVIEADDYSFIEAA